MRDVYILLPTQFWRRNTRMQFFFRLRLEKSRCTALRCMHNTGCTANESSTRRISKTVWVEHTYMCAYVCEITWILHILRGRLRKRFPLKRHLVDTVNEYLTNTNIITIKFCRSFDSPIAKLSALKCHSPVLSRWRERFSLEEGLNVNWTTVISNKL